MNKTKCEGVLEQDFIYSLKVFQKVQIFENNLLVFGKISNNNENVVSQTKHQLNLDFSEKRMNVFTETHPGVLATNGYCRNRLFHDISDEYSGTQQSAVKDIIKLEGNKFVKHHLYLSRNVHWLNYISFFLSR